MLDLLKKSSFFIIAGLAIICFLVFTNDKDTTQQSSELHEVPQTENLLEEQPETNQQSNTAIIDVKGAVVNPGVYEMTLESRVNDVILFAGGFLEDADQSQVNLAQKVQDEMIIIVPRLGESSASNENSTSGDGKVRINYATQDEIETLPGIGPSKAEAIIQHREEHGLFQTIEDILQVSGIGEKTLENMQEEIQVP